MRGGASQDGFVYPAFGGAADLGFVRIGGAGLSNLLLCWARSVVVAERVNARLLAPVWPSLKIGPLLRGELERRFYAGLFRTEPGTLTGWAKLRAFSRSRQVVRFVDPLAVEPGPPGTLYVPYPHAIAPQYLKGLFGHQPLLARRLVAMTRTQHVARARALPVPQVAVHVRLGDFAAPPTAGPLRPNTQLPIEWYADRMMALRERAGPDTRFTIFSDGTPEQLAPLLKLPGVSRRAGENAIVDLLSLSGAQALIASASTFSLWGAFLGQMPSIWHPEGLLQSFPAEHSLRIGSAVGEAIPEAFVTVMRAAGRSAFLRILEERPQ